MTGPIEAARERAADRSASNRRIATAAESHRFGGVTPIPFLCECDCETCCAFVNLTLHEYRRESRAGTFVVAPGHTVAGRHRLRTEHGHWVVGGP